MSAEAVKRLYIWREMAQLGQFSVPTQSVGLKIDHESTLQCYFNALCFRHERAKQRGPRNNYAFRGRLGDVS